MREKFERSLMSSNRACSSRKRREFHENGANPCRRKPPLQISGAAIEHLQRDEMARPMPALPPVTRATLPENCFVMSGRRPLIKGFFAALRLIVGAVMSSAC
jgi:hypothetical protein